MTGKPLAGCGKIQQGEVAAAGAGQDREHEKRRGVSCYHKNPTGGPPILPLSGRKGGPESTRRRLPVTGDFDRGGGSSSYVKEKIQREGRKDTLEKRRSA